MIFRSMCKDCKLHPNINVQLARSACVQSTNRHDVTLFVSPKYLSPVGVHVSTECIKLSVSFGFVACSAPGLLSRSLESLFLSVSGARECARRGLPKIIGVWRLGACCLFSPRSLAARYRTSTMTPSPRAMMRRSSNSSPRNQRC